MVCNPWFYRTVYRSSIPPLRGDFIEILVVGLALLIGAIALLVYAAQVQSHVRKEKKSYGIPDGSILYSDLNIPATPLFSKRFRLTGKPDYIVHKGYHCIPVEVKSGSGSAPYQSQVLQLVAYCQILEDTSGEFVPEGVLVYNNNPYTIPFNPKLRFELETVMKSMRTSLRTSVVKRNHRDPRRCIHCSMRQYCTDMVQESL